MPSAFRLSKLFYKNYKKEKCKMFNKDKYGKILVPMVTPFKEDQRFDYEAAVSIVQKLVDDKLADSIILTGTTGEFFTMTFEERVEMFRGECESGNPR
jgi:dihydrodipicolinate synthase/N-acetylneuraminate lyase